MTTHLKSSAGETAAAPSKSFTRFFPVIARCLMGLPLFIFGLNGFLHFIPEPKVQLSEGAAAFSTALLQSGYMLPLIAGTHLLVGLSLLTNRFVPLALVVMAAFLVNSLAFHIFLEHSGLPMAAVFCALELYLAWSYRRAYGPLLTARYQG